MTIRIITDSTCDLPASLVAAHDITVVPCYINMAGQSYLDGVELTREDFYARLPTCDPPPTTSAPGIGNFIAAYTQAVAAGAEAILSIHISAQLSNVVNVARIAAEEFKAAPVTVIDAGQLTIGTGLLALTAAKAARDGRPMADILARIAEKAPRVHTHAAVDTLTYLQRSGRLSRFQSLMGAVLRIKPLLSMNDDHIEMGRKRTTARAMAWLRERAEALHPLEQLVILHTDAAERAAAFQEQIAHLAPPERVARTVGVTPVLGAHLGPGVIGFTAVQALTPQSLID
ncbi:MAG: DegV family protein [Anaerolineales bacterium]